MGDINTFINSSWKKMVISKSNDEWTSTMKSVTQDKLTSKNCLTNEPEKLTLNIEIKQEEVETMLQNREHLCPNYEDEDDEPLLKNLQKRRRKGSAPKHETQNERASRLARMSAYSAQRLANESPEKRAARLKRMSDYASKRLAQETNEQRAKRLARMSAYAAKRLANETADERQARLVRMSAYAARRQAMKRVGNSCHTNDLNIE